MHAVELVQVDDAVPDQLQQDIHKHGIKLRAASLFQFAQDIAEVHLLPVDTVCGHRVESVGHADDPGIQRDLFAFEPLRISAAVIPLMVEFRALNHVVQQGEVAQDLRALDRMGFHHGIFLIRQAGVLVQDRVGNGDLSDVVHVRGPFDILAVLVAQAELPGNLPGIQRHAAAVAAGTRILGVHRAGNGDHRLFAHLDQAVCLRQFPLHPDFTALYHQPGDPRHRKHRQDQHIQHKPGAVVQFLFLDDGIGPLREDVLLVVVEHRQVEYVIPGGKIGVDD